MHNNIAFHSFLCVFVFLMGITKDLSFASVCNKLKTSEQKLQTPCHLLYVSFDCLRSSSTQNLDFLSFSEMCFLQDLLANCLEKAQKITLSSDVVFGPRTKCVCGSPQTIRTSEQDCELWRCASLSHEESKRG